MTVKRCSLQLASPLSLTFQAVTRERYADDVSFQDPVARLRGRNAYVANIQLLRSVFDIEFITHGVEPHEPDGVEARWVTAPGVFQMVGLCCCRCNPASFAEPSVTQ